MFIINPYQFGAVAPPSSLHPKVQAWLDRGTALGYTLPSVTVQNALSDFFNSLDSNGLTPRMKTGYILHAGSAQMATLNLNAPLTYQTTLVNSPIFSEGNGMKSNGTTSYINQPFKSNEFAGIESNLTAIQYISESSTISGLLGSHGFKVTTGRYMLLYPFKTATTGEARHYINDSAALVFPSTDHKGLYVQCNDTSSRNVMYKNGVKYINTGTIAAPTTSQNRLILAINDNDTTGVTPVQFYTNYIATDFLFDRVTDTDELNFRTAFNTYKSAVALP